jgi:multiple sugar transport system ATP-binding protein
MNLLPRVDVVVGLRPELMLPASDLSGEFVPIDFAVDRIEYLSGDRHVYGTVLNLGEATQVIARLPSTITTPIVPGEVAKFGIGVDRLRYFDKGTGLRTTVAPVGAVGV